MLIYLSITVYVKKDKYSFVILKIDKIVKKQINSIKKHINNNFLKILKN